MTEETCFVIFHEHAASFGSKSHMARDVQEAVDMFRVVWPSYRPVAWGTELTISHGGHRTTGDLRREALAAGRTIDYTFANGRYVARGVEDKPASMTPTLDKLEAEAAKEPEYVRMLRQLVEVQGTDGNWNYDDYMVGMFNGMELALSMIEGREPKYRTLKPAAVTPKSTAHPALSSLSLSADLAPSSHQVLPGFGSAAILKTR